MNGELRHKEQQAA